MSSTSPTPDRTGQPAVVVRDVTKSYGDRRAVDGVSLEVRRGEFFGLLGPNGAGKSTLVEIMEGLRKADSGSVTVLGESPWPRNTRLLPRMGVQTQSSAFFVRQTVHEHLRTVAALFGADREAVDTTLEAVGLGGQHDVRVDSLSGGQRQRLAIASALVHGPELIFLDEPTAALDAEGRRDLWGVLRGLKAEGRTIVYTTHHLDEAEALCDRVGILVSGRLVVTDEPQNLIGTFGAASRLLVPLGRIDEQQAAALPGVDGVTVQGGHLVLETRATGRVLAALDPLTGLDGVQTRTPSLEDVYLEITSRQTRAPLAANTARTAHDTHDADTTNRQEQA
ncbi:ABC transporter [Streptomyces sp. F-3]|jgi:ABC-2 type transport system ATP-binding protein|uniref:ABC transporter ATP-binding protein n=1 Tax=Streptomyces thermogriseus TaxID=75292 RepID=A0ABN1T3M9_9ACTN|nr:MULTISPECIES: ABC transporter ATP-binding protein [Streptomyces]MDN5381916.1 ABC transporter ATP-binding protein [Streptomyces sp. LB8]GAT84451.1 ABC transporter [Streptomyces sp. F-3]